MKTRIIILAILIAIAAVLALIFLKPVSPNQQQAATPVVTPSLPTTPSPPATPTNQKTVSDGTITFSYITDEFGLALRPDQIPVSSYIPSCDGDFNYCLYYIGTAYKGTNFESAGLRITRRTDLATEKACTTTPPSGFDAATKPSVTSSGNGYTTSTFANIGGAAAGHSAAGTQYRLFVRSSSLCYEFETLVGQTQYLNYPKGSIKEFTAADSKAMQLKLANIVAGVSLSSGEKPFAPSY